MKVFRRSRLLLDLLGLQVKSEWIPSVANRFANALSRHSPGEGLLIHRQLRRSIAAGMQASVDSFNFRSLGESPTFLHRAVVKRLLETWNLGTVRLLCPPIEIIRSTMRNLTQTYAPEILLIPDWARQRWYQAALSIMNREERVKLPPKDVWMAQQMFNPK